MVEKGILLLNFHMKNVRTMMMNTIIKIVVSLIDTKKVDYSKKKGFYSREDSISLKQGDEYASNIKKEEIIFIFIDENTVDKENEDNT